MCWCGLVGHDDQVERFRRNLASGRLASTFLFCGPPGVGKRRFALRLAQGLLCERRPEVELDPCLECPSCQQVEAGTHPDVEMVSRPPDRANIPISLLIGDRDHRSREGLCHRIALKPVRGRRKIAIIDDADHLNEEGANALLKTLEEPPPGAVLILIGTSPQRQLPTIRSRCQLFHFRALPNDFVESHALAQGWVSSPSDAERLAEWAEGSLDQARDLADPEIEEFRRELLNRWNDQPRVSWEIAKMIETYVDAAGKEAPARRIRLQRVIFLMVHHLRQTLRERTETTRDSQRGALPIESAVATCTRLERCLVAFDHLDANANLPTLITCWIDDLCQEPPVEWPMYA